MQHLVQILTEKGASSSEVHYITHAVKCSAYLDRLVTTRTDFLSEVLEHIYDIYAFEAVKKLFFIEKSTTEAVFLQCIRQVRQKIMAHIIIRDLNGLADFNEVVSTITALAEASIQAAIDFYQALLSQTYGWPCDAQNQHQHLIVVGMGKLGGAELNVSSDVDLIFAYEQEGETDGDISKGQQVISNQDFFTRLGKKLIAALDEVTADGFVFRVDMRLRPFGTEGSLVSSLEALEEYYQTYGREWERYAWIKGRVVAGPATGIYQALKPFVFRKYLDFNAYAAMRDLKVQIQRDVLRRGLHHNIKLGRGGIREIEFIAQVFQLIRGGQSPDLQVKATLATLDCLKQNDLLPAEDVAQLKESYVYLRNLEHRLMYIDDQQTQDLPTSADAQQRLLYMLGLSDWDAFMTQLNTHRECVKGYFDDIFKDEQQDQLATETAVWQGTLAKGQALEHLGLWGYLKVEQVWDLLQATRDSQKVQQLPDASKMRLDQLMPLLIKQAAQQNAFASRDQALIRTVALLENICRRASYLALLSEFPDALRLVVKLCGASPWLAQYLSAHPNLLDELLSEQTLFARLDYEELENNIYNKMLHLRGEAETQMDAMRHFKHANALKIATQDIIAGLPLEFVSDDLSALAQVILKVSLEVVWQNFSQKHQPQPQFAVIAYGKLGGKELGYLSDLDIIFLHDDEHENAQEIYARFAQRLNNWFNALTNAGLLYETDLQLRPDGNSGLLVSSIEAFTQYQLHKAWLWEHQAISRARFVAGNANIGEAFERTRVAILRQTRDITNLQSEVCAMRYKMREAQQLKVEQFDIKHGEGGLIDVEFMVQFWILAYAHRYASLTDNIGNIALLEYLAELDILKLAEANTLIDAYRAFRLAIHRAKLQSTEAVINIDDESGLYQYAQAVTKIWQQHMANTD